MKKARVDFKTGMRHLANMMGVDPYTFTQADANVSQFDKLPLGTFQIEISVSLVSIFAASR